MNVEIEEGERQMILLALGHLSRGRPGWDYALNEIAKKMDNVQEGRAVAYDQHRVFADSEIASLRRDIRELRKHLEGPFRSYQGHFWNRLRGYLEEAEVNLDPNLLGASVYGEDMSQVHSKFKAFVAQGPLTQDTLEGFAVDLNTLGVAPKSVGVEYLEGSKRTVLSIGYSEGSRYPIKLRQENLGKVEVTPEAIAKALESAANQYDNVICHEFYATEDGTFFVVLMLQE